MTYNNIILQVCIHIRWCFYTDVQE